MVSREILNSHPISTLRKEISKTNIKGYSKMKKTEIVELMMKTPARFSHIKKKEGPPPKEKKKVVVKQDSSKLEKIMKDRKKKAEPKKVMAKPKADVEPKSSVEPKRPPPKKKEMTLQEQRNKMTPTELFSQLPAELKGKIGDTAVAMNVKDSPVGKEYEILKVKKFLEPYVGDDNKTLKIIDKSSNNYPRDLIVEKISAKTVGFKYISGPQSARLTLRLSVIPERLVNEEDKKRLDKTEVIINGKVVKSATALMDLKNNKEKKKTARKK